MRSLRTTAFVGLVATIAVAACSSSDKKHTSVPEDSGAPDVFGQPSTGGTGGGTSTGGASGSGGGLASGGTASVEAGTPDASVTIPDASVTVPDAGPLYCPNIPIGRVDGGAPDAATSVPQWKDWARSKCGSCPAATITCPDLIGAPSSFDPVTHKLRLELKPGVTEMTSATFTFDFIATQPDGGTYSLYAQSVPLVIDGNTLAADLSSVIPAAETVTDLRRTHLNLTDACGTQTELTWDGLDDGVEAVWYHQTTFPVDGAAPFFSLQCER